MSLATGIPHTLWQTLPSTCVSDALDSLGLHGALLGLRPLWPFNRRVAGFAVTVQLCAASAGTKSRRHLGVHAIEAAVAGDVLVFANEGRLDMSCFGGVLATAAKVKGLAGVVADGACRDLDEYLALDFPVFAHGPVVVTARGRLVECSTNEPVQCGAIQVSPRDIVVADMSGVVIVPAGHAVRVLQIALSIAEREREMIDDLLAGSTIAQVDEKYHYETMLSPTSLEPESQT